VGKNAFEEADFGMSPFRRQNERGNDKRVAHPTDNRTYRAIQKILQAAF
jgi:hypothetical protein